MDKILKISLIGINLIMLIFAYLWFKKGNEYEPLILILGQCATILVLIFEDKISKNYIKNVTKSNVKIHSSKNDLTSNHLEDINESKIEVK